MGALFQVRAKETTLDKPTAPYAKTKQLHKGNICMPLLYKVSKVAKPIAKEEGYYQVLEKIDVV